MTTKITTDNIAPSTLTSLGGPKISEIVYPGTETATNPAGGQTITITGTGFNAGFSIIIGSTSASVTTYVSSTEVTFTAPAASSGTYVLYLINTDGGTAISIPGLSYSGVPNWSTAAGSLGTSYETTSINTTVVATGDVPITYSLYSGTLPTGSTLSSGGLLSGTAPSTASTTTYSFTIAAKDAENQTTNRAFSLTINPDVVTWSSPADNTTYNVFTETAISNVAMSATSAGSGSITYTANALPTGLSISGANIAGTPTVAANSSTLLTATSSINSRAATRTINWVVSVSNDIYFKNVTLLLNGETTVTPFISDASTNSFALTINGDTKPTLFNPYTPGYYSNYFDGTGDYFYSSASSANAMGTGDYTVEAWIYVTAAFGTTGNGRGGIISNRGQESATTSFMLQHYNGKIYFGTSNVDVIVGNTTMSINTWYHVAITRSSGTVRLFLNGVSDATAVTGNSTNHSDTNAFYVGIDGAYDRYPFTGYISNARLVKGTAVYTSAFTPPTSPLTAIANTSLLTCQSNRFIDNSTNNFTITKAGDTTISPNTPFTQNSSYSTYGSTYFDGTGDTLSIPSPTTGFSLGTGEFTIECWVYKPSALNTVLLDARSSAAGLPWAFVINDTNFPYWYDNTVYTSTVAVTLNSWNHVAVVRTSGVLKIFVNGVQGYSASYGTNLDRTAGLIIGDTVHAAAPLLGYISDLRIVKGTAVYTSAFTPPTAPLTAIANTQLLTLQYNGGANNSGIIDNSNFNNIITRNGNTSQGSFSPYSVTGWSNYFNGSSDYLSISSNSVFNLSGSFTVEAWVYVTANPVLNNSGSNTATIVTYGNASYTNVGYEFDVSVGAGSGVAFLKTGTGTGIIANYSFALNTWYHVAVTYNGTTGAIYVNGISQTLTTNTWAWSAPTSPTFYIAKGVGYSGYLSYFPGYASNIRVVNGSVVYTGAFTPPTSPLTPITNTTLLTCQSNRFIDNSPNIFTLTPSGTPSIQALDPFGSIPEAVPISYSTYFDGTGDYITAPSVTDPTGDFTIELWWYPTVLAGSTYYGIFVKGNGIQIYYYNGLTIALSATNTTSYFVQATAGTPTLNVWNHIALVRNGNTYTGYLNGTGTVLVSSASLPNTGGGVINIGAYSASYYSSGYMSNVRYVVGTAVYTANFTPSTTPLTAITNTQLLTCQSARIIDNSANAFTITAYGDTKPRIFNPFGYTAQSATSYTPSLHGGSIYLDGTGDNLTTPNISSWQFGTGDFTVEFWVYAISSGTMVGLTSSGAGTGYWNAILSSGNVGWASGVVFRLTSGVSYFNGWMHVAYVRKSGTLNIYINGINQSSGADSTNYNATVGTLKIGTGDSYGTMNGYISDLRITKGTSLYTSNFVPPTQTIGNYSTSYPSQLLLNFNNGGIIDQHSSNVLETAGNAQLSTAIKKYGNASIYFDGTGDYLSIPASQNMTFGTGSFTIEFWCYAPAQGTTRTAFIGTDVSYGANFWTIQLNNTSPAYSSRIQLWCYNMNAAAVAVVGSTTLTASTWYHVAVVRNGTAITIYLNGTSDGTGTSSASLDGGVSQAISIAKNSTDYYTGYIDDLRITKGYARYTSNFTAPTSALITK